jgi:hypothetical protein
MKNKMIASALAITIFVTPITAFASDNTNGVMVADDGNNVDFSVVMQSGPEQVQSNQTVVQPTTGVTADFDGFHKQMDAFLESAGFDYSEFTSQKFSLPDMTNISSAADMKEEYAEMIAGLSMYGFGQQATLPDNSGYALNAIGSFKDAFGNGLKSEFTPYTEFTFDNKAVFEEFSTNRDTLFSSARNSTGYYEISQMMNISDAWDSFSYNKWKIGSDNISPELLDFGSLEAKVHTYADDEISSLRNEVDGQKGEKTGAEEKYYRKKQKVMDLETELKEAVDQDFQIVYNEEYFDPPSYDNNYMGSYVIRQNAYDIRTDGLHNSKVKEKMASDLGLDPNLSDIDNIAEFLKENKSKEQADIYDVTFGDILKNLMTDNSETENDEENGWSDPTTELMLNGMGY